MVKRAENEVGKTKSICARIKHLNLSIPVAVTFRWRMNCSQWPQYLHFLPLSDSHVFGQKEFFEIRDKKKFRLWKLNFRLILQANFFSTDQRIFHLSWLHAQTDNSEHQLKKWNESSQFISYFNMNTRQEELKILIHCFIHHSGNCIFSLIRKK